MKVPMQAHVVQSIIVDQFNGIVSNITVYHNLSFNDGELLKEGKDHNRLLHISVKCLDNVLARVLVDTGFSLNVIPKSTLFHAKKL